MYYFVNSVGGYDIEYQYDAGWWNVSVRGIDGCYTQGKTIEEANHRILDLFSLFDIDIVKDFEVAQKECMEKNKDLFDLWDSI